MKNKQSLKIIQLKIIHNLKEMLKMQMKHFHR